MTDSRAPLLVLTKARSALPPPHWLDLSIEDRRDAIVALGQPAYRAAQVSKHLFEDFRRPPSQWSDLPLTLRGQLETDLVRPLITEVQSLRADRDTTVKTLWRLHDGSLVESVLMRYPSRSTLCVSSQAGCGMDCPFCATGQGGLQRNLSTAEILAQVLDGFRRLTTGEVPGGDARVANVVFMGMGEPLANYPRLMAAIRTMLAPSPAGLGMSARGITVSTVGLVPQMRKLALEGLPLTLALSLHAPSDELRDEIVPMNTQFSVDEVLDAAKFYFDQTGRRISIEYALMRDINDQAENAEFLARRLTQRGRGWVHVNLIPLNPTPGSKWTASRPEDERAFVRILERHAVPVTVRDTRGSDIDGACGQLAATERTE